MVYVYMHSAKGTPAKTRHVLTASVSIGSTEKAYILVHKKRDDKRRFLVAGHVGSSPEEILNGSRKYLT